MYGLDEGEYGSSVLLRNEIIVRFRTWEGNEKRICNDSVSIERMFVNWNVCYFCCGSSACSSIPFFRL